MWLKFVSVTCANDIIITVKKKKKELSKYGLIFLFPRGGGGYLKEKKSLSSVDYIMNNYQLKNQHT